MQKLFFIIALLCIAHQPLHAQVVQELNTRSAVKVMVVKDGIGIPQVAALPTNPALLNYNSTAATGSPVWCSCAADTLRRGLNIWNGTTWETIRAAELPGTINWLDSSGQPQGRPLFTTVGNKTTTSPYYLFSADLRKLVINSTNISYAGNDKRLAVNGAAHINDLYLSGELVNTGPPSGSSTYPLGWNPISQQVEKYTEWPGGISYPLSPGKYLNAYGTFAPLNTDSAAEGSTNLYFTNARARAAIGLTTTGSSGAATYNSSTGVLNIPAYSIGGLGGVPTSRTITINGTALDLSADRSWTISGGGGGITGIGSFASTGDAKGLSVSGTDVIMHPATSTTPGGISTTQQNIPGAKAFDEEITTRFASGGNVNVGTASILFRNAGSGERMGIGKQGGSIHFFGAPLYTNPSFRWYFGGDFNNSATDALTLSPTQLTLGNGVGLRLGEVLYTRFSTGASINTGTPAIYLHDPTTPSSRTGIAKGFLGGIHFFTANDFPDYQMFRFYGGGDYNQSAADWMRIASDGVGLYGSNHASAALTVNSTTKGFLPPRMNASQANAIASKAEGLLVYVTDTGGSPFNFTGKGWWGWNGTTWEKLNP